MKVNLEFLQGIEIVIKVQETCNINCSYCYMYNVGNAAHKIVPPRMPIETCGAIGRFVGRELVKNDNLHAFLVLHGGEPMLMVPREIQRRLIEIKRQVTDAGIVDFEDRVSISVQTNGMLVSPEWLAVIAEWNINVGVSIDGLPITHDKNRVDKKGRGTYSRTVAGLRTLQGELGTSVRSLGALCVIDPGADGGQAYRHLADDLGLEGFSFLLPFMNWDTYDSETVKGVGRFLVSAFHQWTLDLARGRTTHVRVFREALNSVRAGLSGFDAETINMGHYVIVVESDGTVMTEESLRPTYEGLFSTLNIGSASLEDILRSPQHLAVIAEGHRIGAECLECAIVSACRGGNSIGRVGMKYDSSQPDLRKSVYCEAFVDLYVAIAATIRRSGGDYERFSGFLTSPIEAMAT